MGDFSDLIHGLFVLLATASYLLPAYEGMQRRSVFYASLFGTLFVLSLIVHAEETGLAPPLSELAAARMHSLSTSLSYFLLNVMALVAFEIKNESLGRSVAGVWAFVVLMTDPFALSRNLAGSAIVAVGTLAMDITQHNRRFTPAYWKRLGLIAVMALVGAGLFRLLKVLWVWHGIWHLYSSLATWLLLLAQRHKQRLLAASRGKDGGSQSRGHSSNVDAGLTTPVKRGARVGGGAGGSAVKTDFSGAALAAEGAGGAGRVALAMGGALADVDGPIPV
jgi:hypothetical protein